jgi:hypothetical protein
MHLLSWRRSAVRIMRLPSNWGHCATYYVIAGVTGLHTCLRFGGIALRTSYNLGALHHVLSSISAETYRNRGFIQVSAPSGGRFENLLVVQCHLAYSWTCTGWHWR